jgi:hypothetical protein
MKMIRVVLVMIVLSVMISSCGVDGDPGHCYFSVDWEYYNDDYRVYYYSDSNPDVPNSEDIERGMYYDCYPGTYDYMYRAEDPDYEYTYNGYYSLVQNPGYHGGLFADGLDGADTYTDLFLYIYAKKGLSISEDRKSQISLESEALNDVKGIKPAIERENVTLRTEQRLWEQKIGNYTLIVNETLKVYKK